ncbi:MAG TPA: MarR family transcriptional regulator [Amycolatopsis sp.]|nr:MarR family transcriptional regulator [Amycolatopsis sp.]
MTEQPVRWLNETEMAAWRSYIVATLRLRQRLHRELSERHDVSLADYEVLVCLDIEPREPRRMSDLAELLGSTKSRLSHQIARLEDADLVSRTRDTDDKRGIVVELTDAGSALLSTAAPTHVEGVREHLIDLLSPEEQATIATAFDRVLDHLSELGGS